MEEEEEEGGRKGRRRRGQGGWRKGQGDTQGSFSHTPLGEIQRASVSAAVLSCRKSS